MSKLVATSRVLLRAIVAIGRRWHSERHSRSAAALAFYSLFSLVPILVLASSLAAFFVGRDRAEVTVGQAAEALFDERSGTYIQQLLENQPPPAFASVSSVIGIMIILYIASKVVRELRLVLDSIFGPAEPSGRKEKMLTALAARVVPMLLVLASGLLLALSAVIDSTWQLIATQADEILPAGRWFLETLHHGLSLVLMVLLFSMVLKWLPSKPPRWLPALLGSCVSVLVLALLKQAILFYFTLSGVTTAYGAAVTLVVILLWIFFTVQAFFFGSEVAAYLDQSNGRTAREAEPARNTP